MIKDKIFWETWEAQYIASEPPDFMRNLRLVDAMYEHARAIGVFPLQDPLEGLDTKIRLAKVVNVRTNSGTSSSGA
jgi:hypothetical protein